MSTNVEGQFVSPNDAKPPVVRSAYYKPQLTEFCMGFEFEVLNTKGKLFIPTIDEDCWILVSVGFGILGDLFNINNLLLANQIRVRTLNESDFESIGCLLKVERCVYYGTKNVYYLDGIKDSERGIMDGFDTTYLIEQEKFQWLRIIKVDIGGFAGGETKREIFHGVIKNKSELNRILQQLGGVQS